MFSYKTENLHLLLYSFVFKAIHRKELEKKIEIKKVEEKNKIIEDKKKLEQEKYRQLRNIEIVEQKIKLTEDVSILFIYLKVFAILFKFLKTNCL